jgi:hypothetical protein
MDASADKTDSAEMYKLALDQLYEIKVFYGVFNHDGHEDPTHLQGGKPLQLQMTENQLRHNSSSRVKIFSFLTFLTVMASTTML